MRPIFIVALAAIAASSSTRAGTIDFTPTDSQRVLEGMTFPQILFHQDDHQISYEPPRGWSYSGDTSRLKLSPPGLTQAQAIVEQNLLPSAQPLDESMKQQLANRVIASVPGEARNIQLLGAETNPVRINQQESYEVFAAYSYFGQDYEVSVIFANIGDLQLRFRFVARKADFETLHRAFRASLFSLHWR